jgi:hypothetical protein
MTQGALGPQRALGFLTVLEHEQHGLVGGYLLLNVAGRPLEFHCTAPVKPNRAQQILFGPTLQSYLYGEQIGQILITKSGLAPLVVCTDVAAALCARDYVVIPMSLVVVGDDGAKGAAGGSSEWRIEVASGLTPPLTRFALGRNQLATPSARDDDRQAILDRLGDLGDFDLGEPFARIREAIEEAHKGARAAMERPHGSAAA